jgi:hypothetical protein
MKTAIFTNFSNEPFTGYWDGKPKTFKPGQQIYMPDYLAKHFAKHLTNRELLKLGKERSTSPKRPQDVPEFMELFNKAYQEDEEVDTSTKDPVDIQIKMANANRKNGYEQKGPPIVVDVPGLDDEDEDGEESFEGKPVDNSSETE